MSNLLVKYNTGLKAKRAIQQVKNFHFPPRANVISQLKHLCQLVDNGFKLDKFPDADASFAESGQWVKQQYLNLFNVDQKSGKIEDVLNPIEPQDQTQLADFLAHDAKMAQIYASAIQKWLKDASTYEEARRRSAALQLKNADVPDGEAAAIINNPEELRRFIQDSRGTLVNQLNIIKQKLLTPNPMNLPTPKELELYNKHKKWFENASQDDNNPYPNDNAVVYSFLIMEIFQLLKENASKNAQSITIMEVKSDDSSSSSASSAVPVVAPVLNLWLAYEGFCTVFMNANKNDSNNKAWITLASCPDFDVAGVNVGKAMREYVSDQVRTKKSGKSTQAPKLQSGLQRGPRRTERICAISIHCYSQFTILNVDGKRLVENLIILYNREEIASAAVKAAKTIKPGAVGLSDAESIAWLTGLGRVEMLGIATGRNDCSLPKLVGKLVNIDVAAFATLEARRWAVTVKGA